MVPRGSGRFRVGSAFYIDPKSMPTAESRIKALTWEASVMCTIQYFYPYQRG